MAEIGLSGRGLGVLRGDRVVFAGIDVAIRPGAALLLIGPNGAGKSTLLRVLAGLVQPAAGTLDWNGASVLHDLPGHAARVAWVGHLDAIKPALTVVENVSHRAALTAMGLDRMADLPARVLSAGQRRRLALARLLSRPAPLWLLDEPTIGLDADSVARLGAVLTRHRDGGGMVVAATHVGLPLPDAETLRMGG